MKKHKNSGDPFLEESLTKVDRWIKEGKIPISSRVIPIGESLSTQQWVLPTEQAVEILRNSRTFALTECICRNHYKRCSNPVEVCLLTNDAAEKYVTQGKGRYISLDKARDVLEQANKNGLVHLAIYNPDQHIYALCSCCPCCCHDLQFLSLYGRDDLIAHSDYVAQTNKDLCIHCGDCVERCVFQVRILKDGELDQNANACYGCGLCVTVCSVGAIEMRRR
jgi:ferredoxin